MLNELPGTDNLTHESPASISNGCILLCSGNSSVRLDKTRGLGRLRFKTIKEDTNGSF